MFVIHPRFGHQTFVPPGLTTITCVPPYPGCLATIGLLCTRMDRQSDHHWGGIECASSGSKSKHTSPDAIHVCELDPFPVETIGMVGVQAVGQPNTGSNSTAGAHWPSPTAFAWTNGKRACSVCRWAWVRIPFWYTFSSNKTNT